MDFFLPIQNPGTGGGGSLKLFRFYVVYRIGVSRPPVGVIFSNVIG
jgi:hypothetical protein